MDFLHKYESEQHACWLMWTETDTKLWIHEIQLKLEAYDSYLNDANLWIEHNEIESERLKLVIRWLTLLWVSYQFVEPASKQFILEYLNAPGYEFAEDILYILPAKYGDLDHIQLLEIAATQDYSE